MKMTAAYLYSWEKTLVIFANLLIEDAWVLQTIDSTFSILLEQLGLISNWKEIRELREIRILSFGKSKRKSLLKETYLIRSKLIAMGMPTLTNQR